MSSVISLTSCSVAFTLQLSPLPLASQPILTKLVRYTSINKLTWTSHPPLFCITASSTFLSFLLLNHSMFMLIYISFFVSLSPFVSLSFFLSLPIFVIFILFLKPSAMTCTHPNLCLNEIRFFQLKVLLRKRRAPNFAFHSFTVDKITSQSLR